MSFWKWSKTAGSNNTADSTVNLREGQAPSSLNDANRGMMAALAKYRDDIAGMIATGGSSTAYTVTSNQSFTSLQDGIAIAFVPHATNGDGPTLNVDSLGAKPLRGQSGVALGAGALIQGTPYVAVYDVSGDEWLLHGYYGSTTAIPIGGVIPYCGTAAPNSNFVLCYGQAISRTTYATLFALVSTTFGVGDGSTTFNVPDLRGRVIAGKDDMGGSSANRLTGQSGGVDGDVLGATGGAETHVITEAQMPAHNHTATVTDPGHQHTGGKDPNFAAAAQSNNTVVVATSETDISTDAAFTGISVSISTKGSGAAHNNVQPTLILPYIMRVI